MKCFVVEKNRPFPLDLELQGSILRFRTGEAASKSDVGDQPPEDVIEERGDYLVTKVSQSWREVDLESLRGHHGFSDRSCFMLYDAAGSFGDRAHPGIFDAPFAMFPVTLPSKMTSWEYHSTVVQAFPVISIMVPFADSPVSEWAITANVCGTGIIQPGAGIELAGVVQRLTGEHFFPAVRFSGPPGTVAAGGSIEITFRLAGPDGSAISDHDADAYLEATAGALSHSRRRTSGGEGFVTYRATDVPAGDLVKIKCGFKHFSGTDSIEVLVV